jgi:XRE family transcriptional regulator, regulator of sulfur utilization
MNLGTSLKLLRKSRNLKQNELCKEIGISTTYMSQVEKGTREPSLQLLRKFSDFYEAPLPVLLWFSLSEKDIADEKIRLYRALKPTLDKMIGELFITKDDEN